MNLGSGSEGVVLGSEVEGGRNLKGPDSTVDCEVNLKYKQLEPLTGNWKPERDHPPEAHWQA